MNIHMQALWLEGYCASMRICKVSDEDEEIRLRMIQSAAVDSNSVRFTNMASDPSALSSSSSCQSLSPLQPVSVSLKGLFLQSTPSDLEEIYSAASDYGQYNKLRLYNSLLEKIGGID